MLVLYPRLDCRRNNSWWCSGMNGSRSQWNQLWSTESRKAGNQSSSVKSALHDCRVRRRAVAFIEIILNLLKAGKQAIGHLQSNRRFTTARVRKRAVAFIEISLNLLKARKQAISHLQSNRRFTTARVRKRAVAFIEISLNLLLAKTWHMKFIPSFSIKTCKRDCF